MLAINRDTKLTCTVKKDIFLEMLATFIPVTFLGTHSTHAVLPRPQTTHSLAWCLGEDGQGNTGDRSTGRRGVSGRRWSREHRR